MGHHDRSTHVSLVPDCELGKALRFNSSFWRGESEDSIVTQSAPSATLIIAQINEGRELVSQCSAYAMWQIRSSKPTGMMRWLHRCTSERRREVTHVRGADWWETKGILEQVICQAQIKLTQGNMQTDCRPQPLLTPPSNRGQQSVGVSLVVTRCKNTWPHLSICDQSIKKKKNRVHFSDHWKMLSGTRQKREGKWKRAKVRRGEGRGLKRKRRQREQQPTKQYKGEHSKWRKIWRKGS